MPERTPAAPEQRPPAAAARPNPYVGPRSFRTGEALYGRDREILELVDLLIAERIVLLYSPSGAGKTSLIQAALVPALRREEFLIRPVVRVGQEPPPDLGRTLNVRNRYTLSALLGLEEALPPGQQTPLAELAGLTLADYLGRRAASNGAETELLIFDQFEEVLTVVATDQPAKEAFFDQLGAALRDRRRWALFAMREDFLPALDPYLFRVPTRLGTTFRLDFLRPEAARQAIRQPARMAGVDFPAAAAERLIDDLRQVRVQTSDCTLVDQPGPYVEPVQLQVVCRRLWDRLPAGATQIRAEDVEAVGSVNTALADYYDETIRAIAAEAQVRERALREWFERHLITDQGIRGQVLKGLTSSKGLDNEAIRGLVRAHLVRAELRRGATWFELAHDRLIEPVKTSNAAWRKAHLGLLQVRADLWEDQGRPDGLLLRSRELEEAERWAEANRHELSPADEVFLEQCRDVRDRADQKRRQRKQRLIVAVAVLACLVSVATIWLSVWALRQEHREEEQAALADRLRHEAESEAARANNLKQEAEEARGEAERERDKVAVLNERIRQQLRISQYRKAAWSAISQLPTDPEVSILLAREAADRSRKLLDALPAGRDTDRRDAEEAYRMAVIALNRGLQSSHVRLTLRGHGCVVNGVAFSPDGKRLATAGLDATAKVWDVSSGTDRLLFALNGHAGEVRAVTFSRDGKLLATASQDGTALLWDAAGGTPLRSLKCHLGAVNGVAFSPDGTRLATAGDDQTAKVWEVGSGKLLRSLRGSRGPVNAVAFSPDGRWLAAAGGEAAPALWDVVSGQEKDWPPLPAATESQEHHRGKILCLGFSPDGQYLATGGEDATTRVWDVGSGRAVRILYGHAAAVLGVAFHPDGKRLATTSRDQLAKVWDVASGRELVSLAGHQLAVTGAAFDPAGTRLATASEDETVRVWEVDPGAEVFQCDGLGALGTASFSRDGKRLATAGDAATRPRLAQVWDASSGRELFTLEGHGTWVRTVASSPDGRCLATGDWDGTVKVWEASSGKERLTLSPGIGIVSGVAFSPDGRRLAVAGQNAPNVQVWDAATGLRLLGLSDARNTATCVTFSPDGQYLAAGSLDHTALLWNAADGQLHAVLSGHADAVYGVAFSPDNKRLATGSYDGTARVWDVASGAPLRTFPDHLAQFFLPPPSHLLGTLLSLRPGVGHVWGVAFSPDGKRLATGNEDKSATVWDVASGRELYTVGGHTGAVNGVAFAPDGGRLATVSSDGTARLWDASSGAALLVLQGHGEIINGGPAFDPTGKYLATASNDGTAKVWDTSSGKDVLTLGRTPARVYGVALSPDGRRLAESLADGTVRVCDFASAPVPRVLTLAGRLEEVSLPPPSVLAALLTARALTGHTGEVTAVGFNADGARLATGSTDRTVKVWDAARGRELVTLIGHAQQISVVAFSADGARLATGSMDRTAKVWDAASGELAFTLRGHDNGVNGVAFSPDGRRLVTGSADRTAKVWDAATGEEVRTLTGHTAAIYEVAFSPDGTRLATASLDQTAKVWDVLSGQELLSVTPAHTDPLFTVAFSPDGRYLSTVGRDGTLRTFALHPDDLFRLAKERVTRKLTKEELKSHFPDG